jgi:RNA polymerase sigma-70 factor (ECF subfamily)
MDAAEAAARASYGRLLSLLAVRTGDLAGAEDALGEAFLAAVETWPRDGVPRNPDAWLWTAARRKLVDGARRRRVRAEKAPLLTSAEIVAIAENLDPEAESTKFPDERLRLLFVCAHPAIDPAVRTPLMLQTVLALDAGRIAAALRIAPKTMGQRLWRAKTKIRRARIPFEVEAADLPERQFAVLEAIYAAYGSAWEDVTGDPAAARDLTEEAIWLARLVVGLLPREPEPLGLLATMLYAKARERARRDAAGAYVALSEQDTARWDHAGLAEAEATLREAARLGRIGPFQLEAAIQSAHVHARLTGRDDAAGIAALYEGLLELAPTLGARVAHAVARARVDGPARGIALLEAIEPPAVRNDYQPYWSARAHLLESLGLRAEARDAYDRAMGLAEAPHVRRFLHDRRMALADATHPGVSPDAPAEGKKSR